MNRSCRMLLAVAVAAVSLLVPLNFAWAQAEKPVAVVAVQSFNQLMEHMDFLAKAADQADAATMAQGTAAALAEGIDKTRPMGAVVTAGEAEPKLVLFVPVSDMDKLLAAVKELPGMGPPEDAGDGVYRAGGLQPAYIKQAGEWAFVAPKKEFLTDLPADPSALLDGLEKKYAAAVRVYIQNIPADQKEMTYGLLQEGMAPGMEPLPGEGREEFAVRKKWLESRFEQMKTVVDEMDQLTIGWAVDPQAKQTYLDIAITAVPGTELAEEVALVTESASQFAGFTRDDAALKLHFVFTASKSDIEEFRTRLTTFRTDAVKWLEMENLDDEAEAGAKEVLGLMFDVADSTIEAGKLNGGAVLLLGDSPCFAAGGTVSDGKKLDDALRKMAVIAAEEPDFPKINWDADVQGNVSLHTMYFPIPEEEARQVFGDQLEMVIGTSDSSIYMAAGKNAVTTLKEIIVASSARAGEKKMPFELTLSVKPILDFAAQFAPAAGMVGALEGVGDKITIVESPIENGARVRITLDEGILKAVGGAVGLLMAGFGGPEPGGFDDGF